MHKMRRIYLLFVFLGFNATRSFLLQKKVINNFKFTVEMIQNLSPEEKLLTEKLYEKLSSSTAIASPLPTAESSKRPFKDSAVTSEQHELNAYPEFVHSASPNSNSRSFFFEASSEPAGEQNLVNPEENIVAKQLQQYQMVSPSPEKVPQVASVPSALDGATILFAAKVGIFVTFAVSALKFIGSKILQGVNSGKVDNKDESLVQLDEASAATETYLNSPPQPSSEDNESLFARQDFSAEEVTRAFRSKELFDKVSMTNQVETGPQLLDQDDRRLEEEARMALEMLKSLKAVDGPTGASAEEKQANAKVVADNIEVLHQLEEREEPWKETKTEEMLQSLFKGLSDEEWVDLAEIAQKDLDVMQDSAEKLAAKEVVESGSLKELFQSLSAEDYQTVAKELEKDMQTDPRITRIERPQANLVEKASFDLLSSQLKTLSENIRSKVRDLRGWKWEVDLADLSRDKAAIVAERDRILSGDLLEKIEKLTFPLSTEVQREGLLSEMEELDRQLSALHAELWAWKEEEENKSKGLILSLTAQLKEAEDFPSRALQETQLNHLKRSLLQKEKWRRNRRVPRASVVTLADIVGRQPPLAGVRSGGLPRESHLVNISAISIATRQSEERLDPEVAQVAREALLHNQEKLRRDQETKHRRLQAYRQNRSTTEEDLEIHSSSEDQIAPQTAEVDEKSAELLGPSSTADVALTEEATAEEESQPLEIPASQPEPDSAGSIGSEALSSSKTVGKEKDEVAVAFDALTLTSFKTIEDCIDFVTEDLISLMAKAKTISPEEAAEELGWMFKYLVKVPFAVFDEICYQKYPGAVPQLLVDELQQKYWVRSAGSEHLKDAEQAIKFYSFLVLLKFYQYSERSWKSFQKFFDFEIIPAAFDNAKESEKCFRATNNWTLDQIKDVYCSVGGDVNDLPLPAAAASSEDSLKTLRIEYQARLYKTLKDLTGNDFAAIVPMVESWNRKLSAPQQFESSSEVHDVEVRKNGVALRDASDPDSTPSSGSPDVPSGFHSFSAATEEIRKGKEGRDLVLSPEVRPNIASEAVKGKIAEKERVDSSAERRVEAVDLNDYIEETLQELQRSIVTDSATSDQGASEAINKIISNIVKVPYHSLRDIATRYRSGMPETIWEAMRREISDEAEYFTLSILLTLFGFSDKDIERFQQVYELEILPRAAENAKYSDMCFTLTSKWPQSRIKKMILAFGSEEDLPRSKSLKKTSKSSSSPDTSNQLEYLTALYTVLKRITDNDFREILPLVTRENEQYRRAANKGFGTRGRSQQ